MVAIPKEKFKEFKRSDFLLMHHNFVLMHHNFVLMHHNFVLCTTNLCLCTKILCLCTRILCYAPQFCAMHHSFALYTTMLCYAPQFCVIHHNFLPYNAVAFLFVQNSDCYTSCGIYGKPVSISYVYVFIASIPGIVGNVKMSNKIMFISWEIWYFMAGNNNNSERLLRSSGIVFPCNVYRLCGFEGSVIWCVRRHYI